MTRRIVTHVLLLIAVVATIGCDQVTKRMATTSLAGAPGRSYLSGIVRVAYVENTGGFLGLGSDLPPAARTALFTGATGIMLAGMIVFAIRERLQGLPLLGVTLFVAGGASNWIDRLANGHVVDFLNVGVGPIRTGIFNVADVALMLGGAMLIFAQVWAHTSVVLEGQLMSVESNREIGRKFFEAQDRMRGGPDPDLCAPSYIARLGSNLPMTFADHQAFARAFYGGFPDLQHTIHDVVATDDVAVVRFTLSGTHQGNFMGIPATQKPIEVGAIAIFSIAGGRITEVHGQFDQLGMMRQLGVIP